MTTSANNRASFNGEEDRHTRMLTREDTASYLAVSKRTLDRLIQAGEIPAYRIGGHRRFRVEDIDSFIDRRKE
jgi:excisionase family DNA binding protein